VSDKELRRAARSAVEAAGGREMGALEQLFAAAAQSPALAQAINDALHRGTWGAIVREEIGRRVANRPADRP